MDGQGIIKNEPDINESENQDKGGSMDYVIKTGNYEKLGVQKHNDAVVFTFEGEKQDDCSILFYGKNNELIKKIKIPSNYCQGAIYSVAVSGVEFGKVRYNYEVNGTIRTDAYARRIIGREKWNDTSRAQNGLFICGGTYDTDFFWEDDARPQIPKSRMIMYKLHVRGFSMDAGIRGKERGTFRAVEERIDYLKKLGITTLEVMPAYEFEEIMLPKVDEEPEYLQWESKKDDLIKPMQKPEIKEQPKVNYWGYTAGYYFAPKASYSSVQDAAFEWKSLIKKLHENQMECIMEMHFSEDTNPNMVLEALRFWVREYHVDGFHLLGKAIPVEVIARDVYLGGTKIFCDDYSVLQEKQQKSYVQLFVYSDEYLYPVRKLLNHFDGSLNEFLCQQRKQHATQGFVNYVANQNGFTLADVFCFCEKHNEANGEDNLDGNNWNYSSNYGVEGKSRKRYVEDLRHRQMRNAIAALFLAQGVPLLLAGDEFGNSQKGNNNVYCQDNRIGWLNWKQGMHCEAFTAFVSDMIHFREKHPVITLDEPMRQNDYKGKGCPDLSYHGEHAWISMIPRERQAAGVMHCGDYAVREDGTADDFIYVGYNFYSGINELALPKLPEHKKWYLVMNTSKEEPFLKEEKCLLNQHILLMESQSICIVIGK